MRTTTRLKVALEMGVLTDTRDLLSVSLQVRITPPQCFIVLPPIFIQLYRSYLMKLTPLFPLYIYFLTIPAQAPPPPAGMSTVLFNTIADVLFLYYWFTLYRTSYNHHPITNSFTSACFNAFVPTFIDTPTSQCERVFTSLRDLPLNLLDLLEQCNQLTGISVPMMFCNDTTLRGETGTLMR